MVAETSLGLIAEIIQWIALVLWIIRATLTCYKAVNSSSSDLTILWGLGIFAVQLVVLVLWMWAFYTFRGVVAVRGSGFEIVVPLLLIGLWVRSALPRPKKWGFLGFPRSEA